jgi:hypothetical protein
MRTQLARVVDLDEQSWRLPRVDPTGWLARRPAGPGPDAGTDADVPAGGHGPAAGGPVAGGPAAGGPASDGGRRRPRRTAAARLARERELARRRRRRQGRVLVGRAPERASAVASTRRVVESGEAEGYRIGRWSRLTLTVLMLATLALIGARLVAGLTAGMVAPVDVTVLPGDTLWSIAAQAAPDRDPRAVIEEIRRLNQVSGDVVRVGEVLRVPVSPDRGSAE